MSRPADTDTDTIAIPTLPVEQLLTPEQIASLSEPVPEDAENFAQIAARIREGTPKDEWLKLPRDLSINLDHYLYGHPKQEDLEEEQQP